MLLLLLLLLLELLLELLLLELGSELILLHLVQHPQEVHCRVRGPGASPGSRGGGSPGFSVGAARWFWPTDAALVAILSPIAPLLAGVHRPTLTVTGGQSRV